MVYGLTGLLSVLIPDVPSGVKTQIQREKLLAREVLFETELNDEKQKRREKWEKLNQKLNEVQDTMNNTLRQRESDTVSDTFVNDIF